MGFAEDEVSATAITDAAFAAGLVPWDYESVERIEGWLVVLEAAGLARSSKPGRWHLSSTPGPVRPNLAVALAGSQTKISMRAHVALAAANETKLLSSVVAALLPQLDLT